MGKKLEISLQTGKVEVPGAPADAASEDEKNDRTLALVGEVEAALGTLERKAKATPREVVIEAWVLHTFLEAHPLRWIRNYAERRRWTDATKRLEALRDEAGAGLGEGGGKQLWDDLAYARGAVELLFTKLRAQGEVQRLILTPLGKLEFAKVRYQREGPEDLSRVCRELEDVVRGTADLDARFLALDGRSGAALLRGEALAELPPGLAPSLGAPLALLLLGLAGLGVAGGAAVGAVPGGTAALGGAGGLGALLALGGGALLAKASGRRRALPGELEELARRFRERLYVIASLRGLYQLTSRFTRASDALDRYLKDNGGPARWKRVKLDEKDLTRLFAEGTEAWHPRETIETWLGEQVTKAYRLDSQTLASPGDIDPDAWGMILRAYQLVSDDAGGADDALLDRVAELLFIRRGEDTEAERRRVFELLEKAWAQAGRAG